VSGHEPIVRLGITIPDAPSTLLATRSAARLGSSGGQDAWSRRIAQTGVVELAGTFDEFPDRAILQRVVALLPDATLLDVQAPRLVTFDGHRQPLEVQPASMTSSGVDRYELWERFRASLDPLATAGRLGCVIVWLASEIGPSAESWAYLATLPERLPGITIAVELGPAWVAPVRREETLGALAELGLGSAGPPLALEESDEAVDRENTAGYRPGEWVDRTGAVGGRAPSAGCAVVRMSDEEPTGAATLEEWVRGLHPFVATAREIHVLVSANDQRFDRLTEGSIGRSGPAPSSAEPSTAPTAARSSDPAPSRPAAPAEASRAAEEALAGWQRGHQ